MEVLGAIAQWLDVGFGAACFAILVRGRIPQRVTRIEQHLKLPPIVKDAA